jgi:hypothetical protein
MGIAERRATKEFQEKSLPGLLAEIRKHAGFEIPIDITWEQLAKVDYADSYGENWQKVYFTPTIEALKSIARDEMGRDALKAGLKAIKFCNTSDKYSASSAVTFGGGELVIDHDPCCNVDYVTDRTDVIRKELERAL